MTHDMKNPASVAAEGGAERKKNTVINIAQSLDAALLSAVLDMPAAHAIESIHTIPMQALTPQGETVAQALLAHAQELATTAPEAPLSLEVIHSSLISAGALSGKGEPARQLLLEITGDTSIRWHFPALLKALREQHYRAVFRAVAANWEAVETDTIGIDELTTIIREGTEQLRSAYVGDDSTVTQIHHHRKVTA